MKHLLTGVAVLAALAFVAPAGAQQANPSGGNALGLPGPNPGGPGLTPYSTGPGRPAAAPAPSATAPAMPPPSTSASTSAAPPKHRHARHAYHGKMAEHYHRKGPQLTGGTANQLNQEELARLQAGNYANPGAPPAPSYAPPPRQPNPPMGTTGGGAPYRP